VEDYGILFQYNPCYYSTRSPIGKPLISIISIQPLLLFNLLWHKCLNDKSNFNTTLVIIQLSNTKCSSFRKSYFNTTLVIIQHLEKNEWKHCDLFQYNPCYYSTIALATIVNFKVHFNTTLVIIQQCRNWNQEWL